MVAADAFLVVLRESLEAFLVLGILTGIVTKLGRPDTRRHVYGGAAAGAVLSLLLGLGIQAGAEELFERYEALWEGIAALIAVAILTYMIVWMYKHTIELVSALREKAKAAVEAGKPMMLAGLAFIAVLREGVETVLFLGALAADIASSELAITVLAALAVGGVLAYLLFKGVVQLSLKGFFGVTGVLLILFGGGLLAGGVHELAEAGVIPETAHLWDMNNVLSEESTLGEALGALFGYDANPTLLQALVYWLYVGGFGIWYLRGVSMATKGEPVVQEV